MVTHVMWKSEIFDKLHSFDIKKLKEKYHINPNTDLLTFQNFYPTVVDTCGKELLDPPIDKMKHFTRKGSCMYECNDLSDSMAGLLSTHTT